MSAADKSLRLLMVEIRFEKDVVLARQRARQLAQSLGFESQVQTRIATAVSEIARNAFQYAAGGRAEFTVRTEAHPAKANDFRQSFVITVSDSGPGIPRLDEILEGRYHSPSGLGIGIVGTQRLMDRVEIDSTAQGSIVTLVKILPPAAAPRSARQLQAIVDELSQRPPAGPMEEMQIQNQELLRAMEESRVRQEELARVNQELAETNTGVLALYDELETLNRISVMLASKLELQPLVQSIIDVTTTLTGAEIGAFFSREEDETWRLNACSGARTETLRDFPPRCAAEFFGAEFSASGVVHTRDLELLNEPSSCTEFSRALQGKLVIRSCITAPVVEAGEKLIGAFVFANSRPNVFSERSERILASITAQAAIGIEKARLFQAVTAASAAKDQFFATLSHELRTPLNPALAIVSGLHGDQRIPPDLRQDLLVVERNIRLEARLIDDLLDFNRLIKGKLELMSAVVDVHVLIENVVDICREDLEAKNHRLTAHLSSPKSTVFGDAARLQQVLWNVLKNAIKFTPADGAIAIRTELSDDKLHLRVSDTGRGIEPGSVERIFSAFEQGPKRIAAHFGGLGLGLSIARMFVDLHHGRISASSPGPGQGATITIELPLCAAPTDEPIRQPRLPTAPPPVQGQILLVDDHADTLSGLSRLLKRRGFDVITAANAAQAIALAQSNTFDLLISDLGLPDCSGLELVAKISAIQDLPAIALSGYGMESDLAESKRAGFQMHITKPVDFEQLLLAVNTLLTSRMAHPAR